VRHIRYPVSETMEDDDECGTAWDVAGFSSRARPHPRVSHPHLAAAAAADAAKVARRAAQQQQQQRAAPPPPSSTGAPAPPDAQPGASTSGPSSAPSSSSSPRSLSDTAAFLESLFDASYAAAQPEVDVAHCYRLLDGCPWLVARPVYVLTLGALRAGDVPVAGGGGGGAAGGGEGLVGTTYTLRTKVVQRDAGGQLAKVRALVGAGVCVCLGVCVWV